MRPDGDKAEHVSPELLLQMAADDGKSGFACEGGYSSLSGDRVLQFPTLGEPEQGGLCAGRGVRRKVNSVA